MSDTNWDDFRYFLAVAKTASIKKAAVELKTTQSAVSKHLERLERALGVRLFERSHAGSKPTYQGERILIDAMSAEAALKRAREGARVLESRIEGDCSLLTGDGVANYWMPQYLEGFFGRYPDIELRMTLDHDLGAERNEVFDLRLHYRPPSDSRQISRLLCMIHFVPFAAQGYLARFGMPRSAADLANHRLIDQSQYLISKGSWSTWFVNAHLQRTALFTNQSSLLARAVRAEIGIALMPSYMVLLDPEFVPLNIGMRFSLGLYVTYDRERAAKQPVRMTLNFLREIMFDPKNMPWFQSEYIEPEPRWQTLYKQSLARTRPGGEDLLAAQ